MSEIYGSEYAMIVGRLCTSETCQIHHAARIKFQFEFALFISRADY